ncbi:MAG: hypothetical protein DRO76_00645 [Candidatus Altiarchaeales archaeon]|nr:MAG: hypothetical protein DRO76_00645 [Candidatus Altiarchaeales archaeon]
MGCIGQPAKLPTTTVAPTTTVPDVITTTLKNGIITTTVAPTTTTTVEEASKDVELGEEFILGLSQKARIGEDVVVTIESVGDDKAKLKCQIGKYSIGSKAYDLNKKHGMSYIGLGDYKCTITSYDPVNREFSLIVTKE